MTVLWVGMMTKIRREGGILRRDLGAVNNIDKITVLRKIVMRVE